MSEGKSKEKLRYRLTGEEPTDAAYDDFLHDLTNVPDSSPSINIPIDEVGITNQQVVVRIQDIDNQGSVVSVPCSITLSTSLKDRRGVHMSRCGTVIFDAAQKTFSSLDDFAHEIAQNIMAKQNSDRGMAKVVGTYLHLRPTPKSGITSHDRMYLISEAEVNVGGEVNQKTGVQAYNITACPCTLTHTKFLPVPQLRELGLTTDQIQRVLDVTHSGTHTQRGTINLVMDKTSPEVNAGTIYSVLDDTTHLVYDVLKRPDEHELVLKTLGHPQFTEDVVREAAKGIFDHFDGKVPDSTSFVIESQLLESIHIHDVRTVLRSTIGKIRQTLDLQK